MQAKFFKNLLLLEINWSFCADSRYLQAYEKKRIYDIGIINFDFFA